MSISVLGPTFEDLAMNVNKNISNLSYIFVGRSAGYIGGSLIGGALFDNMNPHLLLGNVSLPVVFPLIVTATLVFQLTLSSSYRVFYAHHSFWDVCDSFLQAGAATHRAHVRHWDVNGRPGHR